MSLINDLLDPFPFLHKNYERACLVYEECIELLLLRYHYLLAPVKKGNKKTILCYPEKPIYYHALYQICNFSRFNVTNKPQKADVVIHFEDTTYRKYDKVLKKLRKKYAVINYHCWDISKEKVEKIHKKVFGYGTFINPQTYKGKCVKKGNINSLHNGVIIDCAEKPQHGYIYQKLINNEVNGELVEFRVPVFGYNIPFVYFKYRPINDRFGSKNNRVKVVKPTTFMSRNEYKKILNFCHIMGLDFGELDVLRDKDTKKIYIVDVNNTPASPPYKLPLKEYRVVLQMMSDAFQKAFL